MKIKASILILVASMIIIPNSFATVTSQRQANTQLHKSQNAKDSMNLSYRRGVRQPGNVRRPAYRTPHASPRARKYTYRTIRGRRMRAAGIGITLIADGTCYVKQVWIWPNIRPKMLY